jgi:flagellum-specific ATP synthase
MPKSCDPLYWPTVQEARRLMATYADMEELILLGAYRKGTTPDVDLAIAKNPLFEDFLRQGKEEATSLSDCYDRLAEIIGHSGGDT